MHATEKLVVRGFSSGTAVSSRSRGGRLNHKANEAVTPPGQSRGLPLSRRTSYNFSSIDLYHLLAEIDLWRQKRLPNKT